MLGIVLGAFLSARGLHLPLVSTQMGLFTEAVDWPFAAKALWFLFGGVLLGFGARVAGGCTSGHSIHGVASLHPSSILATVFFLLFGAISVNLIRVLLLGGA